MSAQEMVEYTADLFNRYQSMYPNASRKIFTMVCCQYKPCPGLCCENVCKKCLAIHDVATYMTRQELCQCDGKRCTNAHASDFDDPTRWLSVNSMRAPDARNLIESQKDEIHEQISGLREETKRWLYLKKTEPARKADVLAKLEKQLARSEPAPIQPKFACALIRSESDIISAWESKEDNFISLLGMGTINKDVPTGTIWFPTCKSSMVIYLEGDVKGISHMLSFLHQYGIRAPYQRFAFLASTPEMQSAIFNQIPWEFHGISPVVYYVPELRMRS